MLKKYLLVLSLLTLNHVVIYGASADQGQSITNQEPLKDQEKEKLLGILKSARFLNFKGQKNDILALVPEQVTLEDQSSTLSEYIKLSVEQNSPFVSIFNDNGTYYSGAALVNGQLPPEKDKDKYVLNLRELMPSSQPFTVATGSVQAPAVTDQGPQLLRLLQEADQRKRENLAINRVSRERGQGSVRPLQNQLTLFAKILVPQDSQTVPGYNRLYPQQTGIPLKFPLLPFGFQQQPTALEMQTARIAEQQRQIVQLTDAVEQLKIQIQGFGQAQQQAAPLPQQEPSTRFEFQGPSLLTSEEMNPSGQKPQASTDRATLKPIKQAMSPDSLKRLILEEVPDADLIAMGVTAFDIAQAQQELAQDALEQLMIDEYEEKEELKRLQIEQDEALAREMQEQEQEEAKRRAQEETQQVQSATQQLVERDEESVDDSGQNQQTEPVTHSNAARPGKREMQRAARARKKAALEAEVKERLINLSDEDYQKFITQSEQNSSHRRSADNADEIKNAALKIYRERSDNNRQLIRAIELARIEKAQKQEMIKRAQEKAQQDQAVRGASAKTAQQKLEEATLAESLGERTKRAQLGDQNSESADSQALQKEQARKAQSSEDRLTAQQLKQQAQEAAAREVQEKKTLEQAAEKAKQEKAALQKSADAQISAAIGLDSYNRITQQKELTTKTIDELLKILRKEAKKNENFPIRLWAARHLIKKPYSTLFDKGHYTSKKIGAIEEAIEFVVGALDYDGIEAAIQYYLNQSSLTENDKKRLEYLMRHAKEECLLPDEAAAEQIRNETVKKLEVKVQEKLKPQDSASILRSLKGQQQPKPNAQMVVNQFTHGLTSWAGSVLLDDVEGPKFLTRGNNTAQLIQELHWWQVSLGAMISTHAQSAKSGKRLYLMEITAVYARLLKAVTLSVANKTLSVANEMLDEETRKKLNDIMQFLSKHTVILERGNGQLQKTDSEEETQIKIKLDQIKQLIRESNELLLLLNTNTSPDFFRNLLTDFQNGLVAIQDLIYGPDETVLTPEQIKEYTQKLNDWLKPLNYLFDIPHDRLEQEDLDAQFSQFYACIRLLRKMINAATTIPALEKLLELTEDYIGLLDKAQHLKDQQDFELVNEHVRSFKETIEENLKRLRKSKTN